MGSGHVSSTQAPTASPSLCQITPDVGVGDVVLAAPGTGVGPVPEAVGAPAVGGVIPPVAGTGEPGPPATEAVGAPSDPVAQVTPPTATSRTATAARRSWIHLRGITTASVI
ncbi:hypothetical protein GCM10028783_32170 [Modestobacter muralis]